MIGAGRKVCQSKTAYPSAGLAAMGAMEFMHIRADLGIERMAAYRCHFCGDWHISKQIRGESGPTMLIVERAPWKRRDAVLRDRKLRRLRGTLEKQRQARQRFLGDDE